MRYRYLVILVLTVLTACGDAPAAVPTAMPAASTAAPAPTTIAAPTLPPAPTSAATPAPVEPTRAPAPAPPPEGVDGVGPIDLYAQTAPEFPADLEWLNTPRPLSMAALRGKIVIVDFWTYGCINCVHNFPDLKRLQAEFPDELVIIGVHSAKFTTESDTENIRQTLLRYQIDYPVVNDRNLTVWNVWNAQAWPTTVVVDVNGAMAGIHVGERVYSAIKPLVATLIAEADARGRLDRTPLPVALEREGRPATVLAFPAKTLADPRGDRLFIADTGHHRIVIADPRTGDVLDVVGNGRQAFADGAFAAASFASPHGMALSNDGGTLFVADTGNHAIRAVDLLTGQVTTLIGTGVRATAYPPEPGDAPAVALSSPWDLALDNIRLYIAMAGSHQIWSYRLSNGRVEPLAGSAIEGIADGPAAEAELAQPSGLALAGDGRLYFTDTEASSMRYVTLAGRPAVTTLAGGGRDLFAFGDRDGIGGAARLQHPQGVTFANGMLYIVDTYNHKIKQIDPASGEVRTWAGSSRGWQDGPTPLFYEPGGISAGPDRLYVADTNNHAIRMLDLNTGEASTLVLKGIERFSSAGAESGKVVTMPPIRIAPGAGQIRLDIILPAGYKVNDLAPSSLRWSLAGAGIALSPDADRSLAGLSFPFDLPATFSTGSGTLTADVAVIYCEADTPELCYIEEVRIEAPFTVIGGGAPALELRHAVEFSR